MINFDFFAPTKILFGAGRESEVGKQVAAFGGHRVMIVYGKKEDILKLPGFWSVCIRAFVTQDFLM